MNAPDGVTVEAYQVSLLLEDIASTAKAHAQEIMNLRVQHALQIQELQNTNQDSTPAAPTTEGEGEPDGR